MSYEERLRQYILENDLLMKDLERVRELGLPQCYIAAGYVRGTVWDRLHGFTNQAAHTDIDVIFYDPGDLSEEREWLLGQRLIEQTGNDKWSVKNQARMHIRNGNPPYRSSEDAVSWWPETATAVGTRLNSGNRLEILAPYGLDDLFGLVVRRSPRFEDRAYYISRVRSKNWKRQWPQLTILED